MGYTKTQLVISYPQTNLPVIGQVSIYRPKGTHGNLQTTQAIAKTKGCTSKTDCRTSLSRTTLTALIRQEEVKLVPT